EMRRDYMVDRINKIPNVSVVTPKGAFYVLINISKLSLTSQNFADRLLSKHHVAVVPGVAFGDDRTIRLSYATSMDVIKKGIDRLEQFCKTL
ncbi:MAG: Aspartate aminotransferase, partial [Verrucomicrobiales bacterium]|nr:Aspartate aminotransferase [Verrucomicrobiales bacterium]